MEPTTSYIEEQKLGLEYAEAILRLISGGHGTEVVAEIVKFSLKGRATKLNSIIFALTLCESSMDRATKKAAYETE